MWPDAGIEQEKRRVKDPWEDVLENMPEVVEKRIWDGEREVYIITDHHIIIHVDDQERVASDAILAHVLKIPIGQQSTADAMRLATVMKLLGWQRPSNGKITIEGRRVQGYFRRVECSDDEPE